MKNFQYLNNLVADTTRGPSPSIWGSPGSGNAWVADFIQDPRLGLYQMEDFKSTGITPGTGSAATFVGDTAWYAYGDTAGVITDANIVGGGITMAAGTTDNAGIALGSLSQCYQLITSAGAYQGRLAFECRVAMSAASYVATRNDMFAGLVDASGTPAAVLPITATGGLLTTAAGLIGFHKRGGATGATDWNFVYQVAGGTAVYATNLQSLITTVLGSAPVGGTFYKLGFVFDAFNPPVLPITSPSTGQSLTPTGAKAMVTVYVNGLRAAAFLTSTNVAGTAFPTTIMSRALAYRNDNTTAAMSGSVDWACVGQTAIS